jgi:pSer/pThr/pTyr-binding forkhead associated (FHA) protein
MTRSNSSEKQGSVVGSQGKPRFFRLQHRYQTYMAGVGTFRIGRRSSCEVVLNDPKVSREHARIIVGVESAAIEDLGSANGLAVNGDLVKGLRQLKAGDSIQIGDQILEVVGYVNGPPSGDDTTDIRRSTASRPAWPDEEQSIPTRVTDRPPNR